MKGNFKRAMSLFLTVLMVLTAVPLATVAAEDCAHDFSGAPIQAGSKYHMFECLFCDEAGYNGVVGATQACYGGEANCMERAVCEGCGYEYGSTNDNHSFDGRTQEHLAEQATCISQAKYYYTCTRCGEVDYFGETYSFGPVDVVNGHWGTAVSNGDGTHCIEICNGCSQKIDNAPCVGGIATCQEKATCYLCNQKYGSVDAKNHTNISVKEAKAATCQEPGYELYDYCAGCNTALAEIVRLPKLEHQYTEFTKDAGADTHSKRCLTCVSGDGKEISVVTELCRGGVANCTMKATCEVCNSAYGDVKHVWNEGEITTVPTCSSTGVKKYTCTVEGCGAVKNEELAISEGAHSWGTTLYRDENQKHYVVCEHNQEHKNHINCTPTSTVVTAPTCEADGYTTYTCACGNTWTGVPTNKLGHNYTKKVETADYLVSEATCQKNAVYYYVCANGTCGKNAKDATEDNVVKTYEKENSKLQHSWNEGTVTQAATCMVKGSKLFTCTTCDPEVATVATEVKELAINADAHDWGNWEKTDADKHKRICGFNNQHTEEEDCKGGTATCTAKAVCSVCEDTYGEIATHSFTEKIKDEAHLKAAATCVTKAVYWYDCIGCDLIASDDKVEANYYTDEEGELLPHEFTIEKVDDKYLAVPADCSRRPIYYKSCACGESGKNAEVESVFETGEPLGHIVEIIPGKDPTCTEDGYTESRICKREVNGKKCGAVLKEQVVRKATGHKEYVSVPKSEATCTKVGYSEEKKCAVCGQLLTLPSMPSPALGHVDSDNDDICDRVGCGTIITGHGEACSCLCHQTGIMKIVYFIVNLIWKLIGANKYCDCGIEHY